MNRNLYSSMFLASTMSMLMGMDMPLSLNDDGNVLHNGVQRKCHPWDKIQLSKSERKGKTPEELQELRKQKFLKMKEHNEVTKNAEEDNI